MSNTRKQQPEKISADCPHCGFSQLESAYAKSTICKRCSQYFSIEKLLAKEVSSLKPPSLFERLGKMMARESTRQISCFSCHATQQVSSAAESSLCPKCGSYIDLRDFRISGPFGRTVQTQGKVVILAKGDVTTRILCGDARIEGKMRGQLVCTGRLELKFQGKMLGSIESHEVVVERKSEIDFIKPVVTQSMEISGAVTGEIYCDGKVTITKYGSMNGIIHSRSIVIEKGGIFRGDLDISSPDSEESEEAPVEGADGDASGEQYVSDEVGDAQVGYSEEYEISDGPAEEVEQDALAEPAGSTAELEPEAAQEEQATEAAEEPTAPPPENPSPGIPLKARRIAAK